MTVDFAFDSEMLNANNLMAGDIFSGDLSQFCVALSQLFNRINENMDPIRRLSFELQIS